MNKFQQENYPRHGAECIFTTTEGDTFLGHYDNGGARNQHFVFSTDTGKAYTLPTTELTTWYYTTNK